jgi:glycosyltransferase involved in cell wall biosynthesis
MKRVLVITYYWPPSGGSGVQRWVKFAKYLRENGWEAVIYTPENPTLTAIDKTLAAEVPADTEVIRRPILEPYGFYRRLVGKKGDAITNEVTPISSGRKPLKDRISLYFRGNWFIPDPRIWWIRPSVRFLKKYLREHPVEAIVTTGPPQSLHLIGQRLHKALGTPWIVDFRDPWSKMYYLKHLPISPRAWRKHLRLEKGVIDDATTVLTVTPLVQELYASMTKTPVAMIPNGFDEEDFAGASPAGDGNFNITHTGLFAQDGNPFTLWKVLGEKAAADSAFRAALRLRLVGKVDAAVLDAIRSAGLAENLVLLGYKAHPEAVAEQRSASVLVLPLRNDPDYTLILPGKLFEYLGARRPVLGIGQEDGAMARVLSDTQAGVTCGWDNEAGMRAFIDKAWQEHLAGGVPPVTGDISVYTRKKTAKALAELLNSITIY